MATGSAKVIDNAIIGFMQSANITQAAQAPDPDNPPGIAVDVTASLRCPSDQSRPICPGTRRSIVHASTRR